MKRPCEMSAKQLAEKIDSLIETMRGRDQYGFIPTLEWIALVLTQKSAREAVKEARES